MILAAKIVFLLMVALLLPYNMAATIRGKDIPTGNFIWQAIGITGFIVLQWLI